MVIDSQVEPKREKPSESRMSRKTLEWWNFFVYVVVLPSAEISPSLGPDWEGEGDEVVGSVGCTIVKLSMEGARERIRLALAPSIWTKFLSC